MLRLYKYERAKFQQFVPSAQTHCDPNSVEDWILKNADASGRITNVCVEFHGTNIAVAHAAEARVLAALYAADHNDYVALNHMYRMEVSPTTDGGIHDDDEQSDSMSDAEQSMEQAKLDDEYEQNEECVVNNFGPAHANETDW